MQWGVMIPMRDGVRLNATLYLPRSHQEQTPAIFTLTPYVGQMWHEFGVYFAAQGYPFLTVDVRGRGNSEGSFRPFIQEAPDGYDVVEWLACQPYCNGQVAMWGGSYAGYDQWATAKEFPPHLATIVPVAAPYVGADMPLQCNIFQPYLMQWLTLVSGRTSQDRLFFNSESYWGATFRDWFESGTPFAELDSFLGNPSAIFQEWISHPRLDDYWDAHNPTRAQYAALSLPILTITGHYDSDQPGALAHYREHVENASTEARKRHYLVIGPWDHFGTRTPRQEFLGLKVGAASLVDLQGLQVQWYEWIMQGGSRPEFLQKNVAYYVMGDERWRYADTLEAVTSHHVTLFLHSETNPTNVFRSGFLRDEAPSRSHFDHYVYDPRDVSLAALESTVDPENRTDQRMVLACGGRHLVYHSDPFPTDREITGFFRLSLWLSIDRPDTDFRVSVHEIDVDGSSLLLSSDLVRARYRESLREENLIATNDPLRYEFERFAFVSRRVKKGNRLRLVVGPLSSIYSEKNYNSGRTVCAESIQEAFPVTVRLFHDPAHPSALQVPIGAPES
jgi:hypothetical protein